MINDNSRYWLRMSSVAGSVDYNKKEEGVGVTDSTRDEARRMERMEGGEKEASKGDKRVVSTGE